MSSIKPWNPDLAINFGGLEILSLVSVFESIELFVVEISIDISLLRKRRRFLANDEKRKVCATQVEHALCCTRARNSWPRQVTESRLRGIFIARWKYTILPVSGYAIFNWYIWPVSESGGNLTRFFIYILTNEKKEQTVLVLLQPTRGRVEQAGHDGELAGKIELLQNDPYPGQGRGGSRGRWVVNS